SLWLKKQNLTNNTQCMRTSFLWRNEKFNSIREEQQTHLVVVSNCTEGQQAGNFGGQLSFRLRRAAKISRRAYVHNQHDGQLAFFGEFFYKCVTHSRGDIPINRTNFIARLILTHVFKIHSASFEDAMVVPGERGFDQAARLDLKCADFL